MKVLVRLEQRPLNRGTLVEGSLPDVTRTSNVLLCPGLDWSLRHAVFTALLPAASGGLRHLRLDDRQGGSGWPASYYTPMSNLQLDILGCVCVVREGGDLVSQRLAMMIFWLVLALYICCVVFDRMWRRRVGRLALASKATSGVS